MRLKGWLGFSFALVGSIGIAGGARAAQNESGPAPRSPHVTFDSGLVELPMAASTPAEKAVSLPNEAYDLGEVEPQACTTGNATFTWTITDGCGDGIYLRFFDLTNSLVWPDANHVYSIGHFATGKYKLNVKRGAKICYGAQDPVDQGYWGLDVDGGQSCASCCNTVPNTGSAFSRSIKLTC